MTEPLFSPEAIIAVLDRHHVEYVVLGGYAANLHGARRPTWDIDVAPATTDDNLSRLVAALRELRAGIRVNDLPEGLPFDTSAEALRGCAMLNLRTPYGDMDLTFSPAAFPAGYADLIAHSSARIVNGFTIRVAALDDIIASKTEAARLKDLDALPELRRLAAARSTGASPTPDATSDSPD